jgi:hypothetical protein
MIQYAGEVFNQIHAKYPDLKLGISHCAQFYGGSSAAMRGSDDLELLQSENVKVDFFSSHGHKPMGSWPDMRHVYESLDAWAKYNVKFHVSEATLDLGLQFVSPIRQADRWTPELAADFFEAYYTTLFSHPNVEAINYWDLSHSIIRSVGFASQALGGTGQAGLLDPDRNDAPRPVYDRMKKLITETWMTRLSTRAKPDGTVAFRGFHGDYEVVARLPNGKTLKGKFSVHPGEGNTYQLRLTEDSSSLANGR